MAFWAVDTGERADGENAEDELLKGQVIDGFVACDDSQTHAVDNQHQVYPDYFLTVSLKCGPVSERVWQGKCPKEKAA